MTLDLVKLHHILLQELSDIADLLQQELEEDGEMATARENNYHFLQFILEQPELHPREYVQILSKKHGAIIGADIPHQLQVSDIYSVGKRVRLARIMESISISAYNLLVGKPSDPFKDFDNIARIVRARSFRKRIIEGKAFLIILTNLPQWQNINQSAAILSILSILKSTAQKGSYKLCQESARRLVDILGVEYGFEKRKTSAERVQDILQDLQITRDISDMRATLLIVQQEFKHLKEEFEQEVHNRNQEFVQDFFTNMNSARYGNLLDTIAQTNALIDQLQGQGWSLDPKLRAIPMVIQIFMNMLNSQGVSSIEKIGATKVLSGFQLSEYEFLGSSDLKADDKVSVIVRTPGWKLEDIVISKPRVEEMKTK